MTEPIRDGDDNGEAGGDCQRECKRPNRLGQPAGARVPKNRVAANDSSAFRTAQTAS